MTEIHSKTHTMRRSSPDASRLPGKGWCFHRGAKLVGTDGGPQEAIWTCPSCQNVTALTRAE